MTSNELTIAALSELTVKELRAVWARLMTAARNEGMDTTQLKRRVENKCVEVPAASMAIYATHELSFAIRSEGTVFVKTGRKVWETGYAGDRNLVDDYRADTSRADRTIAAA